MLGEGGLVLPVTGDSVSSSLITLVELSDLDVQGGEPGGEVGKVRVQFQALMISVTVEGDHSLRDGGHSGGKVGGGKGRAIHGMVGGQSR